MRRPLQESDLTEEMLQDTLEWLAIIVERYGPQYIPLFENIERKLAEVRARGDTRERARKLLKASASRRTERQAAGQSRPAS